MTRALMNVCHYLALCHRAYMAAAWIELEPLQTRPGHWQVSVWRHGRHALAHGIGTSIDRAAAAALADWTDVEATA